MYSHFGAWMLFFPFEWANQTWLGISIAMILAGIISYFGVYFGASTLGISTWGESKIIKSIFGNNYNRIFNFFWGTIELFFGIVVLINKNVW